MNRTVSHLDLMKATSIEAPTAEEDIRGEGHLENPTPKARKIWIDLENSPHVPFFIPIMKELERRGYQVVLTARDCFQVCELAELAGLQYKKIGHHYGKNRAAKLAGLGIRVLQLAPLILQKRPAISLSHGSRSLIVLSALLGIPNVSLSDYEFADLRLTSWFGSGKKKWVITPEVIPPDNFEKNGIPREHVLHYPGIKEDVYVPNFEPDPAIKNILKLQATDTVVTIRPPATEAHYHNPESDLLLMAVLQSLGARPEVKIVLLPRTHKQEAELRGTMPQLFAAGRIVVPKRAVNGLDLIWYSDVVISGGGTMNREAAALGIPVYSFFRGKMGAVDRHLVETGKLVLLESEQDVREKLKVARRAGPSGFDRSQRATLDAIVNHVSAVLENRG